MIALIKRLYGDERIRFLAVGGINTVVGYVLFVVFNAILELWLDRPYFIALYASYAFATILAFNLHRRVTFQVASTGRVMVDFVRFQSVYVVSLVINTLALPLLVEIAGLAPWAAQLTILVVTTLISYFGHKWFSFRRPAVVEPDPDVEIIDDGVEREA